MSSHEPCGGQVLLHSSGLPLAPIMPTPLHARVCNSCMTARHGSRRRRSRHVVLCLHGVFACNAATQITPACTVGSFLAHDRCKHAGPDTSLTSAGISACAGAGHGGGRRGGSRGGGDGAGGGCNGGVAGGGKQRGGRARGAGLPGFPRCGPAGSPQLPAVLPGTVPLTVRLGGLCSDGSHSVRL